MTKLPWKMLSAIMCRRLHYKDVTEFHPLRRCGSGCTNLALQQYAMTTMAAKQLSRSSVGKQEPPGCSQEYNTGQIKCLSPWEVFSPFPSPLLTEVRLSSLPPRNHQSAMAKSTVHLVDAGNLSWLYNIHLNM